MDRNQDARYTLLEHTADTGLTAWGRTPVEAFAAAARGMLSIMLDKDPTALKGNTSRQTLAVEVSGEDWQELLVNWLAELLFHFEVERFVPLEIEMARCEPPHCTARLSGLTPDEEEIEGLAIKAVTYHQLAVDVTPQRTELRVIFDI